MKRLFLVSIFLIASVSEAKMFAYRCQWDNDDIIFAEEVKDNQPVLVKQFEDGETIIKITIQEPTRKDLTASVSLITASRITVKSATCVSVSED